MLSRRACCYRCKKKIIFYTDENGIDGKELYKLNDGTVLFDEVNHKKRYYCWCCHKVLEDVHKGLGYCDDCLSPLYSTDPYDYRWVNIFAEDGLWQCTECKAWSLNRWMSSLSLKVLKLGVAVSKIEDN